MKLYAHPEIRHKFHALLFNPVPEDIKYMLCNPSIPMGHVFMHDHYLRLDGDLFFSKWGNMFQWLRLRQRAGSSMAQTSGRYHCYSRTTEWSSCCQISISPLTKSTEDMPLISPVRQCVFVAREHDKHRW